MKENIRHPAVAGTFYPADPNELKTMVDEFISNVPATEDTSVPRAIIAPHAGYIYSGPVAATAYARIIPAHNKFTRVVLLGPSHRVPFRGLAASSASHFSTPLGLIPLDVSGINEICQLPQVQVFDQAHLYEHSLEVHLPFLQTVIDNFSLIPLVVGDSNPEEVSQVLEHFIDDEHTLIVISSDLSHYHDYHTAQQMDRATSQAIEHMDINAIGYEDACGRGPVSGLLTLARHHHFKVKTVDLRNSGDTAGPRDQVVGYGAYVVQ
ncbi:MAG: AmmeMemoRadiSam system protein B [Gammaproteobacteria bacterium]|jgi:AmmeMemoRadiSam system protein B